MSDEPPPTEPTPETPPGNPLLFGSVGIGLLLVAALVNRDADPGLPVYIAHTLFLLGLAALGGAAFLWYRQAQHSEKERDPEV
jgi:hypothetical protein